MPSKTAEDAARNLIADIEGDINVMTDYEVVPLLARHFQAFAEEYHKQNTPVVSRAAEDVARMFLHDVTIDLTVEGCVFLRIRGMEPFDYYNNPNTDLIKCIAAEIQSFADSQNAELRAENEKLRAVRDYYANPENWRYGRFVSDGRTTIKDDDMYDLLTSSAEKYDSSGGRLARISLEAEHGE
jgi:hypothetical protein